MTIEEAQKLSYTFDSVNSRLSKIHIAIQVAAAQGLTRISIRHPGMDVMQKLRSPEAGGKGFNCFDDLSNPMKVIISW